MHGECAFSTHAVHGQVCHNFNSQRPVLFPLVFFLQIGCLQSKHRGLCRGLDHGLSENYKFLMFFPFIRIINAYFKRTKIMDLVYNVGMIRKWITMKKKKSR
jgi:hypothetical protein